MRPRFVPVASCLAAGAECGLDLCVLHDNKHFEESPHARLHSGSASAAEEGAV